MKKKSTPGNKKERQLRFRYRELMRAGKLIISDEDGNKNTMSFKQFRKSEFNAFTTKKVEIKSKTGKILEKIAKIFIPLKRLLEVKEGPKPKKERKDPTTLEERRQERRSVRHKILLAIQEAAAKRKEEKEARREAKREAAEAKREKYLALKVEKAKVIKQNKEKNKCRPKVTTPENGATNAKHGFDPI